jgi:hypothetical protein
MLTNLVKSLPQLLLALVVLAVVGVLAGLGSATSTQAYSVVMVVLAAGGVSTGIVLGSTQSNANLIPHLILFTAALVLVTVLGARGIFTNTQVDGVLALVVGGGALGIGSTAVTSSSTPAPTEPTAAPVATPTPIASVPAPTLAPTPAAAPPAAA